MRLKLLNGAPLCEHLDFSDRILLDVAECHAFDANYRAGESIGKATAFKWRDIGLKRALLRTGWSQPYLPGIALQGVHDGLSFTIPGIEESSELPEYDATNLDTTLGLDEALTVDDYLEHSLILHETLLSSQVVQDAAAADSTVTSSSFLTTSFGTTDSRCSSPSPTESRALILHLPSTMTVTPLGSLPSAQHLRSIYPQTPTPNLLCALMTTPTQRDVFVRTGGYHMDLWEVTVGDDTRSSFKITFWLRPPGDSSHKRDHQHIQLLQVLGRLHVGDIVLLRNIALTYFRESVHGQSLNASISRARTSVDVLADSSGMSVAQASGLPTSVAQALVKVRRWARSHVAGDADNVRKRKGGATRLDQATKRTFRNALQDEDLPPDTMEFP